MHILNNTNNMVCLSGNQQNFVDFSSVNIKNLKEHWAE